MMLASITSDCNSGMQADAASFALENARMLSIKEQKALRRTRVSLLLDIYGQTELADLTGVSAAYLYQMGKGKGTKARPVNDENAELIERKLRLPDGWLSGNEPFPHAVLNGSLPALRSEIREAGPAPYDAFPSHSKRLDVEMLTALIEVVEDGIERAQRPVPARLKARFIAAMYADGVGDAPEAREMVGRALTTFLNALETPHEPTSS
jgi:hypothetical protein